MWWWLCPLVPSLTQTFALALIALGVLHVVSGSLSEKAGPMMLTFWAFVVISMGIAPLVQYKNGVFPKIDSQLGVYYYDAQFLTLAAAVAYTVGYVTLPARKPGHESVHTGAPDDGRGANRRLAVAAACSLAAFPLGASSGVGIAARFQSRDSLIASYADAGISYAAGQSIQIAILKMLPTILAIVGATIAAHEVSSRRATGCPLTSTTTVAVLATTSFVVFANPLSNTRYIAFSGLLAVLFAGVRLTTRRRTLALGVGLMLGLAAIYPAAAAFKNDSPNEAVPTGQAAFTTVDFDGLQQTASAFSYVNTRGHTNGNIALSGALFLIPRSIWEGKSLPSSYLTTEARGYLVRNLSQPLWSEFYLDAGWVGTLAAMGLIGQVSARLDRRYREDPNHPFAALVAATAAVQIGFLRGPMGAQVVFAAPVIGLVLGAVLWSTAGSKQAAARDGRTRRTGSASTTIAGIR